MFDTLLRYEINTSSIEWLGWLEERFGVDLSKNYSMVFTPSALLMTPWCSVYLQATLDVLTTFLSLNMTCSFVLTHAMLATASGSTLPWKMSRQIRSAHVTPGTV